MCYWCKKGHENMFNFGSLLTWLYSIEGKIPCLFVNKNVIAKTTHPFRGRLFHYIYICNEPHMRPLHTIYVCLGNLHVLCKRRAFGVISVWKSAWNFYHVERVWKGNTPRLLPHCYSTTTPKDALFIFLIKIGCYIMIWTVNNVREI